MIAWQWPVPHHNEKYHHEYLLEKLRLGLLDAGGIWLTTRSGILRMARVNNQGSRVMYTTNLRTGISLDGNAKKTAPNGKSTEV